MKLNLTLKKKEIFLKTVVWNTLIQFFLEKKKIDISDYLLSIKINNKKLIIRSKGSMLSQEILLWEDEIRKKLEKPFLSVSENIYKYKIYNK